MPRCEHIGESRLLRIDPRVLVRTFGDQHALARRDDLGLPEPTALRTRDGFRQQLVGALVVAEHHVRRRVDEQGQCPPLVVVDEARHRRARVGEHRPDAVAAHRRAQDREPRRERGIVRPLGGSEPALGGGRVSAQRVDACPEQRDGGITLEQPGVIEAAEPALRPSSLRPLQAAGRAIASRMRAARSVSPAAQRVVERRFQIVVLLEPVGGTSRQLRRQLGVVDGQLPVQEIAEEVVIPIPLAVGVERHEEEVGAPERLELGRRVLPVEHRVAERPAHPLEQRRAAQERRAAPRSARPGTRRGDTP